jgi:2-oxoglutarate ferredoxin oxidoreductase subunit gamma
VRYDIRLSGSGGQGIIIMGIMLAEAIGLYDGKFVAQTQSYGPQARGGSSKAEIVMSDTEIDYPKALKLDLLLAMNQASCDTYYTDLKPEGILVVDSTFVHQVPVQGAYAIPFTRLAKEKLHREMASNMVALGAISVISGIVTKRAIEKAVLNRAPKGTEKLNLAALRAGMAAARRVEKDPDLSHRILRENEDL